MRTRIAPLVVLACFGLTAIASADKIALQRTLADLYKIKSTTVFQNKNSTVLNVFTNQWNSPQATVRLNGFRSTIGQDFTTPQDWSSYNIANLVLINKENRTANFKFIVQVKPDLTDLSGAFMATFQIRPNSTYRIVSFMNEDDPWPLRLEHLFPVMSNGYVPLTSGSGKMDIHKVYAWRINNEDNVATTVDILDLRLIRQSLDPTGIADKYGQYTDRTWTNKITADSQLGAQKAAELTDLNANPGPGEQQGTVKVLNSSPTIGKWAIKTDSIGRKYLQHPNGRLFWVFGMNTVLDSQPTPVQGREYYFTSLPSRTSKFGPLFTTASTKDGSLLSYSHRAQNLMLKYGDVYYPSWLSTTKKRLASWGVNTVGIDSVSDLYNNSLPYAREVKTTDFGYKFSVPQSIWGSLPDVYSPYYQGFVYTKLKSFLATPNTHSNFMGLFVDNELGWGSTSSLSNRYNVAIGALVAPSTQPAKIELINQLMAKYSTVTNLNSSWKSTFSSWDAVTNNRTWKPSSTAINAAMESDFKKFVSGFAGKYFSQIKAALNAVGFKALYMGCRFANYTPEVVSASLPYVDVVSFNVYRFADKIEWDYFSSLTKPVIFSELGYGVLGDGTFGGIGTVHSQAERVTRMQETMNRAIVHPNVVGVIWYCYGDQPITGRYSDYENTGLGTLDIADTPYKPVVDFYRAFTATMYEVRAGGSAGGGGGGGGGGA